MTALTPPDPARHDELAAMLTEYADDFPHGSGLWNVPQRLRADRDAQAMRSFARLLQHLADPATTYLDDTVPSWYFWLVDEAGELVGFLAFRHRLNPWLWEQGGHVGYSVRPARRREGHARRALGLAVRRAPELGIDRVLVTCDDDNLASAGTIEANAGVLQDVRAGMRRYWITP
ncbi:MAG: GNAT family N-acetyltransferase [Nocardioides sp.]|nr:GNAT family N-acetyltransferase [Nocardioides sp.]